METQDSTTESYSEVFPPRTGAVADSEGWTAQDVIVRLEKQRHKFHSTHKTLYTAIISKAEKNGGMYYQS